MNAAYKDSLNPDQDRATSSNGERTHARLQRASLEVFGERGYHAARVDDIVRAAATSHGTFYLYFANKEDVLHSLAIACAGEIDALATMLPQLGRDPAAVQELERFLERFLAIYRTYGPVIRAWMEHHVSDAEINRLGVQAFVAVAQAFARELAAAGCDSSVVGVGILMAMIERFAYFFATGRLGAADPDAASMLAQAVHRGFFSPRPLVH